MCVVGLSIVISLELLIGLKKSDDKMIKRKKIAIVILPILALEESGNYMLYLNFYGYEVKYNQLVFFIYRKNHVKIKAKSN